MRICNSSRKSREEPMPNPQPKLYPPSPGKALLWMILTITLVVIVTELSEYFFHSSEPAEGILHILALSGGLAPLFYFFWFLPFTKQLAIGRASEREIRSLSHRLIAVREAERCKLARDLHDEFGQKLTSLQVLIEALEKTLAKGELPPPGICHPLKHVVADLSKELRTVLADLRPSTLDDLGLAPALESLCNEIAAQEASLEVDFRTAGIQGRLAPEVETALFRACQEALTNAIKHAQAQLVEVRLTRCHPHIILTIQDNGIGFIPGRKNPQGSNASGQFGLLGMRERVASVGGTIRLTTNSGGGTRIRIEVPESSG